MRNSQDYHMQPVLFRPAEVADIAQIQRVRHAVKENRLSDPGLVTDRDCEEYLSKRGKGWVCTIDGVIAGFAIIDLAGKNIWALFVDPHFEGRGIGRKLQELMLDWYFSRHSDTLWLGTAPFTRAETFYAKSGWRRTGMRENGEIRFEMSERDWKKK